MRMSKDGKVILSHYPKLHHDYPHVRSDTARGLVRLSQQAAELAMCTRLDGRPGSSLRVRRHRWCCLPERAGQHVRRLSERLRDDSDVEAAGADVAARLLRASKHFSVSY